MLICRGTSYKKQRRHVKLNTRRTEDMSAIRLGGLEIRRAGDGKKGSLSTRHPPISVAEVWRARDVPSLRTRILVSDGIEIFNQINDVGKSCKGREGKAWERGFG